MMEKIRWNESLLRPISATEIAEIGVSQLDSHGNNEFQVLEKDLDAGNPRLSFYSKQFDVTFFMLEKMTSSSRHDFSDFLSKIDMDISTAESNTTNHILDNFTKYVSLGQGMATFCENFEAVTSQNVISMQRENLENAENKFWERIGSLLARHERISNLNRIKVLLQKRTEYSRVPSTIRTALEHENITSASYIFGIHSKRLILLNPTNYEGYLSTIYLESLQEIELCGVAILETLTSDSKKIGTLEPVKIVRGIFLTEYLKQTIPDGLSPSSKLRKFRVLFENDIDVGTHMLSNCLYTLTSGKITLSIRETKTIISTILIILKFFPLLRFSHLFETSQKELFGKVLVKDITWNLSNMKNIVVQISMLLPGVIYSSINIKKRKVSLEDIYSAFCTLQEAFVLQKLLGITPHINLDTKMYSFFLEKCFELLCFTRDGWSRLVLPEGFTIVHEDFDRFIREAFEIGMKDLPLLHKVIEIVKSIHFRELANEGIWDILTMKMIGYLEPVYSLLYSSIGTKFKALDIENLYMSFKYLRSLESVTSLSKNSFWGTVTQTVFEMFVISPQQVECFAVDSAPFVGKYIRKFNRLKDAAEGSLVSVLERKFQCDGVTIVGELLEFSKILVESRSSSNVIALLGNCLFRARVSYSNDLEEVIIFRLCFGERVSPAVRRNLAEVESRLGRANSKKPLEDTVSKKLTFLIRFYNEF